MYRNLKAELARNDLTLADVAKVLGVKTSTMSMKMNKPNRLKFEEARKIQSTLFPNLSMSYLFATDESA